MKHGYDKLSHFNDMQSKFMSFLHMGSTVSLILVIFAEFFCAILLILGLFTRLACVPLIIDLCIAFFIIKNGEFFGKGEVEALYIIGFVTILFAGPGRASVDRMIGK